MKKYFKYYDVEINEKFKDNTQKIADTGECDWFECSNCPFDTGSRCLPVAITEDNNLSQNNQDFIPLKKKLAVTYLELLEEKISRRNRD